MKKLPVFFLCLCVLPALHAQDIGRMHSYLDTLCAPGMHGRGYVQQGEQIAAKYLRDQFSSIGLLPFSGDPADPYFQHFPLDINTFPDTLFLKAGNTVLAPGKDFILHPASGSGYKCLKVFRVDTLLFTDAKVQARFLKLKTEKLCLVLKTPEGFKKKWEENLPPKIAEKLWTAGCIIRLQAKKLTASLAPLQLKHPYFEVLEGSFPANARKICFRVHAVLKKNYISQNVIGYVPGKAFKDSFLIVTAHYDHLGRMGSATYFPGANDNGSGIAMLLELARYYKENPLPVSIVFIAFGAEEAGLIGSKYFVRHPLLSLSGIRFLLNLDLEGTGEDGITVVNATTFPKAFDLLTAINQEKNYLPKIQKRGPAPNSDHYPFTVSGVPAFFIYTMGGISAYHDIYDRPETLPLTKAKELFLLITDFFSRY